MFAKCRIALKLRCCKVFKNPCKLTEEGKGVLGHSVKWTAFVISLSCAMYWDAVKGSASGRLNVMCNPYNEV